MRAWCALGLALVALPALATPPLRTTVDGSADLREQSATPAARPNYGRLYTKATDSGLYYLDDSGNETNLLTGGASAAAILAALLTLDGDGSLLDADLLDGVDGDGYCLIDGTRAFTGNVTMSADLAVNGGDITSTAASPTLFAGCTGTIALAGGTGSTGCSIDCTTGTLTCTVEIGGSMTGAEILTALLAVDGSGSGLDADTLDGSSSAAFALVAGGNAFAASNTYAANDITDADVVDTITASNYVLLTDYENADVLAKLVLVDGAASGLDADLLDGSSSAAFAVVAGGNAFAASNTYAANDITDADVVDDVTVTTTKDITLTEGGFSILLTSNGGQGQSISGTTASGAIMMLIGSANGLVVGRKDDAATNSPAFAVRDGQSATAGGTGLFIVYGGGAHGVPTTSQQAITISTGTDTTSPTSSQVEVSCTTAPCTYSPGETSVVDGWRIAVCNVDASDNIDLATTAGAVIVKGSPRTMTPGECATCVYSGAIWGCQ